MVAPLITECRCPIETLFGYTVQIGGLLHDHATLMAASGQCAQTAMQIDQRLRNDLLFRRVFFSDLTLEPLQYLIRSQFRFHL